MPKGALMMVGLIILVPGVWLFIATNDTEPAQIITNNQPTVTHSHEGEEHEGHLANAVNTHSISIISSKDDGFSPAIIRIKSGTKVTWTNNDSSQHILRFTDEESEVLDMGEDFSKTFSSTGTFDYDCGLHSNMSGIVIVEE